MKRSTLFRLVSGIMFLIGLGYVLLAFANPQSSGLIGVFYFFVKDPDIAYQITFALYYGYLAVTLGLFLLSFLWKWREKRK